MHMLFPSVTATKSKVNQADQAEVSVQVKEKCGFVGRKVVC